MNSRERFLETMRWGAPDRVPFFEEGIRADVLCAWRGQGLGRKSEFAAMFRHDRREELHPDLEPLPRLQHWPSGRGGIDLGVLRRDKETIRHEVEAKVPPLLAEGGYIPMLDGRVRADIPFENCTGYKRLLEKIIGVEHID